MELSLICPIQHIEWTKLLAGRFCLAPVALQDNEYLHYFKDAAHAGYKVILDNGIFEENKVRDNQYIDLARSIGASVLVIPDTISSTVEESWSEATTFITRVREITDEFELMYVPQCLLNDTIGFWSLIAEAMTNPDIQWIGICRDAVYNAFARYTHTEDQELNRFYFAARLQEKYTTEAIMKKKWHFLGMGANIDLLQYFWFVDAMDTASLFYQATLGNKVTNEFILPGNLKRPKDYFIKDFAPEQRWAALLKYNCCAALDAAQRAGINRRKILGGRL